MLLTDLFARAVDRHADRVAIEIPPGPGRSQRHELTYALLSAMADAIAEGLTPFVQGEAMVLVLLPRTCPWLFAVQIGVLRAGAAFVCVDPVHPDRHLAHLQRDAKPKAIVTDAGGARRCHAFAGPIVTVRDDVLSHLQSVERRAPHARPAWLGGSSLAYAIYTSGTTGTPKGVLIEHGGVVNLISRGVERFAFGPGDRAAQGSSIAYDSSIEESWLPLASGATLVVLDDTTVRSGPDLVTFLREERITVFCPPPTLLRAMAVRSVRSELPDLRLCYVGGEALPQDLADAWGKDVWLENGYGPTECTVTVVRGRVLPGQPVTIGTPVPPHTAWILDAALQPVADGTPGELCIAGPGLARGYLGLPEFTAGRFPVLPGIGRVYRTGDLVVRGGDGAITCLGRIDSQVKVRGHRIELEAVESVLAQCAGVREVACRTQDEGDQSVLVAHIVPQAASTLDVPALVAAVRERLPEPMVPQRFGTLAALPRTIGGKIDRKALPELAAVALPAGAARSWQPADARQERLRTQWAAVLKLPAAAIGGDDDFFALGGNSLRAAVLVSALRRSADDAAVAVRDVYECPTIVQLAARMHANVAATAAEPAPPADTQGTGAATATASTFLFTFVQVVYLLALLFAASGVAWLGGFVLLPWLGASLPVAAMVLLLPWVAAIAFCLYAFTMVWLAVLAKELLIGRYREGRVPAFSGFHVRHWLVVRLVRLVPWALFEGTELKNIVLRALGARVGKRVHVHRGVDVFGGGWDLLEIGDDVTLQREVDLGQCVLDAGHLVLGRVRIGAGATLATRAGTAGNVEIGAGAVVGPLAFVSAGARVPAGEEWNGVPAVRSGVAAGPQSIDVVGRELPPWWYTTLLLTTRVASAPVAALPFALLVALGAAAAGLDSAMLIAWLCGDGPSSRPLWLWICVGTAVAGLPVALLGQALVLRWMPKVPVGTHARWSWMHLRLQVRTEIVEAAGIWLSGTLFWPWWLRLAGMRIGRDCEVSTILDVLPEHISLGSGSFLADGVYLGVPWQHQGRVTVAKAALGERSFVGNHVVIPGGDLLPDDLLLGISTIADAKRMAAGTGWFGQPAFALPQREVVAIDRRLTHEPGRLRYANRVFWEALRVVLPALPVWLALWWFDLVGDATDSMLEGAVRAALATFACAAILAAVVLVTKWLLLGRVRTGQHGLWSCWASRWDFHYVLWQRYGRALLQQLEGTLLLPWFLRAMGMRIGRRCVLGDGFAQVVDPDMISIEDGATVHALFQAHSFEDRVLKIAPVRIGARATVGRSAVVLYGADIGDRAHVMPHSVVMKNELLRADREHAGAPTRECGVARLPGVPAAVLPASAPTGRAVAFEVARGAAVLGMVFMHFVTEPEAEATGPLAAVSAFLLQGFEGMWAALFLLLAGASLVLAAGRHDERAVLRGGFVIRRALALALVGVPFWIWCWPDSVLLPMALTILATSPLLAAGRGAVVAAIAVVVVATPIMHVAWADLLASDLRDDGTHAANHELGLSTLRWFAANGGYPLLPWLAFPLLGALLAMGDTGDASRWRRWFWLALPIPVLAHGMNALALAEPELLGELAPHLQIEWQPTTLPFWLRNGGLAVAVLAAFAFFAARGRLGRWTAPLAAIGRASLTHYLVHIVLVYSVMRLQWPEEDWSFRVGLAAFAGYTLFALAASHLWFRYRRRGPAEALLAWASGPSRPRV